MELLEEILNPNNLNKAYKKVISNKGVAGVDGITVEEEFDYLKENKDRILNQIRKRRYKPQPVKRVQIPKENGKMRNLGIPTVTDRIIQQAIVQVISPIFEIQFNDNSFGFRPNRSCEQAVIRALEYLNDGYEWIVDIDLERFFDTVNQDRLITIIGKTIKDGDVVSLIRKYLSAGVMKKGIVKATEIGTPQGGNISPILSNIMLNELDKELESRGLKFVRYADDCIIFTKSRKAAERVMENITKFIEKKLRLKVNRKKSKVDRPWRIKYLGFSFYQTKGKVEIRIHPKSIEKFKDKIREITSRSNAMSMETRFQKLRQVIRGWVNYFKIANMKRIAQKLDKWIRRRIRMCYWKQWKKIKTKHDNLVRLGIENDKAWQFANTRKSYWRISNSPILEKSLNNKTLERLGYLSISSVYC